MDLINKLKKQELFLGAIIVVSLITILFLATQKKGMHEDEYYTYLLANNEKNSGLSFTVENGVKLNPAYIFNEYLYADDFDIKSVWNNQSKDVHPPIYYLLFHIFELLAHNVFGGGLKSGIILNAVYHICNILLTYLILEKLLHKDIISLVGCGIYALMPIVLGNVIFVRMYVLLSTFVLLLAICLINGIEQGTNVKFCIYLCAISIGGTLTHYYFLIYLFYSCLVYFIWGGIFEKV